MPYQSEVIRQNILATKIKILFNHFSLNQQFRRTVFTFAVAMEVLPKSRTFALSVVVQDFPQLLPSQLLWYLPKSPTFLLICCSTKTTDSFHHHSCYGSSQSHLPSSLFVVVQVQRLPTDRQLLPSRLLWYLPKSPTFLLVCCSAKSYHSCWQLHSCYRGPPKVTYLPPCLL